MNERQPNVEILMNVPLDLSVELGRTSLRVREIVELGTGSIVALDRPAGGAVDVLVNGKHVARGEIVAVDECYGIRITELCE